MTDERYYKRTIVKETVPSVALNEERIAKIYLPPGYNELLSYPVIYCQDGEDFFNFGRIATHANRLIWDEGMEPVIVAGVDVDKKLRAEEYSPDGSRFTAYCRFFVDELIPFVEQKYPIRQDAEQRILAGDSLGGTVCLHLALDHPGLFRNVIALSGAFMEATQRRAAAEADLSWLNLYMLIGLQEEYVQTRLGTFDFLELNRTTKAILEQRKTRLSYKESPGKHVWGFWQQELPAAMMHFLG